MFTGLCTLKAEAPRADEMADLLRAAGYKGE